MATAVAATPENSSAARTDSRAGKYLIFSLGQEEFGIKVTQVREIIALLDIVSVPNTPPYIRGVINLRGGIIAVVDLRKKFGLARIEDTTQTCIVVVDIGRESGGSLRMGIVVDGVVEVLYISQGDLRDTPDFGTGATTPFLVGMANTKGKIRLLLDIDRVLSTGEMERLEAVLQ